MLIPFTKSKRLLNRLLAGSRNGHQVISFVAGLIITSSHHIMELSAFEILSV